MFYSNVVSTCVNCGGNCMKCSNYSNCLSCIDNYYFYKNTCISNCPLNTYI